MRHGLAGTLASMDCRTLVGHLLALLAPPACMACRAPLLASTEPLCAPCRRALPWLRGERCPRCALPAPCGPPCPARRAAFAMAWSPVAYAGSASALVAALKRSGAPLAAEAMAAQMAAGAPRALLRSAVLVPVPPQRARRRRRGFDPAVALAGALAIRTGLALAPCLRREDRAERQRTASRAARLAPGRIVVRATGHVPPIALLVDDVHTTGATLEVCACALRAAGAVEVRAIAYARTLRG